MKLGENLICGYSGGKILKIIQYKRFLKSKEEIFLRECDMWPIRKDSENLWIKNVDEFFCVYNWLPG